jgi:hypothetical protein
LLFVIVVVVAATAAAVIVVAEINYRGTNHYVALQKFSKLNLYLSII